MEVPSGTSEVLLSQGVLGVVVIGLIWFVLQLRAELRDTRSAHKVELAAKDALIIQIMNSRLDDHRVIIETSKAVEASLDAISNSIRGRVT